MAAMRLSFLIIFVLLGASILLRADIAGFWLDAPGYRNNAHDPKSPLYRPPTAVPTVPSPTPTSTVSPTATLTFTASPPYTATTTATATATATNSVSPSATGTVTPSPSLTFTPTLSPYVYFDGDSPGAVLDGVNRVPWTVTPVAAGQPPSNTVLNAVQFSGSPHSGVFEGRITMAALDFPVLCGVGNTTGASVDVSAYNALSLWMRSVDGCFEPMLMLHSPGTINNGSSVFVTATAYTNGAFSAGTWRHVVVPLAAFAGSNYWGNPYSVSSNANLVDAVMVLPSFPRSYFYVASGPWGAPLWVYRDIPPGNYNTETMDIDDVQFQALPASCLTLKQLSPVFDAFVSPDGITQWNTTWTTVADSAVCLTPTSSFSFPSPGAAPVDGTSGPLNTCFSGHIAGTLGAADGVTAPCGPTDLSSMGMAVNLQVSGAPLSLTTVSELTLTAGVVRGLSFYLQNGPSAAAVDVDVVVRKANIAALNDLAQYRHRVPAAALAPGTWQYFKVDFPATGALGTDMVNSFGQPPWAAGAGASAPWGTADALQIEVMPADTARGQNFDILVGQISFY
jgi:hypothetical protein